jgi:hypothetical protein
MLVGPKKHEAALGNLHPVVTPDLANIAAITDGLNGVA